MAIEWISVEDRLPTARPTKLARYKVKGYFATDVARKTRENTVLWIPATEFKAGRFMTSMIVTHWAHITSPSCARGDESE